MQTIPLNQQLANTAMHHPVPTPISPMPQVPRVRSEADSTLGVDAKQAAAAHQRVESNPYAELDAMLIRDPNTGAVHGVRTALLFNAGLVLSGLMVWELWSLLAS